jgi:hypothetical protein
MGVFGAGMREPAIEATCGARDADDGSIPSTAWGPRAVHPPCRSRPAAMFSLSFASQHARGGRGKTAARSGSLPLLLPSSVYVCTHVVPSVHGAYGMDGVCQRTRRSTSRSNVTAKAWLSLLIAIQVWKTEEFELACPV